MINRQTLLSDLQSLLKRLEADLLERSESTEIPDVGETLRAEYDRAKQAERTAQNYEDWRSDAITQAAAAWVLSCVFVRFLEDNKLIDPPKIAGPNERLQQARDEHELYFHDHPTETDREYLLAVFDALVKLPGTKDVFGEHNPIRELPNWLSGDAAGELLRFFQKIDANSGNLIHDFADDQWDTRFLGDLYQDLSEAARKKYALLQTPEFVEEFILDRTLEPALDEFGLVVGHSSLGTGKKNTNDQQPMTSDYFKMIDPACGSGHFLLGAFPRILDRWQKHEPGGKVRDLVQKTLDCIHGVDVNPYAVAIARFRLLLTAMNACGIRRLADAPDFRFNLACGDSLLHATLRGGQQVFDWELSSEDAECEHAYQSEDLAELKRMLRPGTYHAVVANPPYITPKDRQLNQRYRKRFESCHMKYSLAVPFLEHIFRLAVPGGITGQITANSFMKREFGKKLIESFLPQIDMTHVIDTSGAYIPGHGTPTVILFGRHRPPVAGTIRAVMGIRGEPSTPDDPARGLVWSAIVELIDRPGGGLTQRRKDAKEDENGLGHGAFAPLRETSGPHQFISVSDSERERFHSHPWSIGGGGAAELKERLEEVTTETLTARSNAIGITAVTGEDELYMQPRSALRRQSVELVRRLVVGDVLRDWVIADGYDSIWLYDAECSLLRLPELPNAAKLMWSYRAAISQRRRFGTPMIERGLAWYEWQELYKEKLRTPLSIVFAEVATHNHFVLDRDGKVFNRTAPVIKLPADASEDDHLALLGLLNSSTACFWMKQCAHNKGDSTDNKGARTTGDVAFNTFAYNASLIGKFPLPNDRPKELARRLDALSQQLQATSPAEILTQRREGAKEESGDLRASAPLRELLSGSQSRYEQIRGQMIFLQEELDWQCYRMYGLIDEELVVGHWSLVTSHSASVANNDATTNEQQRMTNDQGLMTHLGQRAFEIVLARKLRDGKLQTTWFERHRSTPITEIPNDWPEDYRQLVQQRIETIESNSEIALIEQPEYKRRWNTEPWESQQQRALREWLLARLESYFDFDGRMSLTQSREVAKDENSQRDLGALAPLREISLYSVAKVADAARQDQQFMEVAEVYRDDPAFDVQRLVEELVRAESVPLLPVLRYKPSGLRKRQQWERTWELQREEDKFTQSREDAKKNSESEDLSAFAPLREIPVPPKYTSSDFISSGGARYWSLRGKLDVPKERWVSFPHCEGPDGTLVIAWAGYDHLQLARAISAYFVDIQERLGGRDDPRLVPLLACIIELLPWLKQWHAGLDPDYNQHMDEVFEGFVTEEAKNLGMTVDEIKAWVPPQRVRGRSRKRVKA